MKWYLFLLIAISLNTFGQKQQYFLKAEDFYPLENNKIEYKEVVSIDSTSAEELYKRSKILLANIFISSPDVIKMEDEQNHIIITKAFFVNSHNDYVLKPKMWFTLTIETKENRYRYSITDLRYTFSVSVPPVYQDHDYVFQDWAFKDEPVKKKVYEYSVIYHNKIDAHIRGIIQSIKNGMLNSSDDDW